MTNKIFRIAALFLILAVGFGCGKKESKNEDAKQKESLVNQDAYNNLEKVNIGNEKFTLQYRFKKGDKFSYKLTTISATDESMQTDTLVSSKGNQNITYVFDFEVLEVDNDNVAELGITIKSVKIDAVMNGTKLEYDTNAKNSTETKLKFVEYETITNTPYRARVNSKGEVLEVTRTDKMLDKFVSLQPKKEKLTADLKANLSKQISEGALRPVTQMIFRELPEKNVAKDSTWEKKYPGNLAVFQIENTAHYKLEDFVKVNGARAAKMSANLSVKSSGKNQGTENGVSYNFSNPKVNGNGIILFNIDNNRVIKAETSIRFEMGVQMEGKDSMQKTKKSSRKTITTNKNIVELI